MTAPFWRALERLQPSQLYISRDKLAAVTAAYAGEGGTLHAEALPPLPVYRLNGRTVLTDGHTRACAAYQGGLREVRVYWDRDELDWEAYAICVRWCEEAGVRSVADLAGRVVDAAAYQRLWLDRCAAMHRALAAQRGERNC
jgi:hypothetical protein